MTDVVGPIHSQTFSTFRVAANKSKGIVPIGGRVLALDPGETTGWASFKCSSEGVTLEACGQETTWPIDEAVKNFLKLLHQYRPDYLVKESYRIYDWKAEDHSWSPVNTIQVIGCFETLANLQMAPNFCDQTAQAAKHFCTDDKLKGWGLYIKGKRHARDAIRHGCYFILFGQ